MIIRLPANNWRPRHYQKKAWRYLENGGRHAELIWHRRSGKDDVALHWTAVSAIQRPGTYWHMLPLANQVRKAIWNAVNPHSGMRRVDEAFPPEIRANTNDNEMFIRFRNGATWQALGSDNFEGAIGSPPVGIVYSEWAQANPRVRGFLRPIIFENKGWQAFITTPRGKNHAHTTFKAAQSTPGAFAQLLTVKDTGLFSEEDLKGELREYVTTYGLDQGTALYNQEYFCDFNAPLIGAYYGRELSEAEKEGRIRQVEYDPEYPVNTAWDLGYDDDTDIWFYQAIRGEIRLLDHYANSGQNISHYANFIQDQPYKYGKHWLPHDARAKTLAAAGKSIVEQLAEHLGLGSLAIVPNLSVQDGIQAARKMFPRCYFDRSKCEWAIDALSQYQREWDDIRKCFKDTEKKDWTNHCADSFRYLAVAWIEDQKPEAKQPGKNIHTITLNELWEHHENRDRHERI